MILSIHNIRNYWGSAIICFLTLAKTSEAAQAGIMDFFGRYCIDCHGNSVQKGNRRYDSLSELADNFDGLIEAQEIVDQLVSGNMPPKKAPQPQVAEKAEFISLLRKHIVKVRATLNAERQHAVLRRLNHREYRNTIGDLFGIEMAGFDPTAKFLTEGHGEQSDLLINHQPISGYALAKYVEAADQIVDKVFRVTSRPQQQLRVSNSRFYQQEEINYIHRELFDFNNLCLYEMPDSETHEGSYAYVNDFAQGVRYDGYYELKIKSQALNRRHPYDAAIFRRSADQPFRLGIVPGDLRVGRLYLPQPIEPLLAEFVLKDDNVEWHTATIWLDAGKTPRFIFPNGVYNSRSSFLEVFRRYQAHWPSSERDKTGIIEARRVVMKYGKMPQIRIYEVQMRGPIAKKLPPTHVQQAYVDKSITIDTIPAILKDFADRACRHPVPTAVLDQLMVVVKKRQSEGGTPLDSLKDGLKALLCLPEFLYFLEPGSVGKALPAHALAARLSYFLTATLPDTDLSRSADTGDLLKPEILLAHTRRLLASQKIDGFVEGFLDSWLNLRSLGDMPPDRVAFGQYYNQNLQRAMKSETSMFMRHVIDANEKLADFIDSDYTFVNQDLATLYGMGKICPPEDAHRFHRVQLPDRRRGGLLGQASVLTVTANGVETSPIRRGVWILDKILGTPPGPPPDDVPTIDPDIRGAKSIREMLEKHRDDVACSECHQKIDPLGFALESFDPIGRWRSFYQGPEKQIISIDCSGEFNNGQRFKNVSDLKRILLLRQEQFIHSITGRLIAYACGRQIDHADRPHIDEIVENLKKRDMRFQSLIELIVLSPVFTCK